jgi:coenzyme F420-reducing hydrogenase gamma subunit
MKPTLSYLGLKLERPRVAFFDFSSCEGCQLQVLNNEATLLNFLNLVEIVRFREAMTGGTDDYEIAFVEGSVTRPDEVARLKEIRSRAKVLVALGTCACFGGVNQLRNRFADQQWVRREVYGDHHIETLDSAQPLKEFVPVDMRVLGCPIHKDELERIVLNVVLGKSVAEPQYPVCVECKARENLCMFDLGEPCLGPVTRAGCHAWCPSSRMGCWGCRGPADDCNMALMERVMTERGFSPEDLLDRLECFGGFAGAADDVRNRGIGR